MKMKILPCYRLVFAAFVLNCLVQFSHAFTISSSSAFTVPQVFQTRNQQSVKSLIATLLPTSQSSSSPRITTLSNIFLQKSTKLHASSLDNVETRNNQVITSNEYFTIESSSTGPASGPVYTLRFTKIPGQTLDDDAHVNGANSNSNNNTAFNVPNDVVIETGRIGRQAAGAVTLTRGDSVLYATASRDDNPRTEIDFLPLSVEHQERFSAAGLTSGAYNKRDGRPAEHEILTCRLIDRPLRPLITSGWRHETQLLSWVLSYDGERSCDPLAIVASATALYLSDIPLCKPVAAVQVGMIRNNDTDSKDMFIINPTNDLMEDSPLHLTVAGTSEAVLMIEGAADFLTEAQMLQAVQFGHDAIKVLCQGISALGEAVNVTKKLDTIAKPIANLQETVDAMFTERVDNMYTLSGAKHEKGVMMSTLSKAVVEELTEIFPDEQVAIKTAFKDLLSRRMYARVKNHGQRSDGRQSTDIRRIDAQVGLLPRVHGSALFTRGETQTIATATLGDAEMRQKIDKIDGMHEKRFYLQYTFPPSSVGETGRVGAPGRREVGHGNLAERALMPTLPAETDFAYTIRVESLVTESHGSSSMASVCGGCLALMDAGVPIKTPIAGIAMGMLLDENDSVSDENAIILSDISGTEDALGTMDFKVAGNREGITTFQLDIKCEGLSLETMERALEQARQGRLHILDEMDKVLDKPRSALPETVPKMRVFSIPNDSIGKVIGPGGKQIRAIIEDFALANMDVAEDGTIQMTSFNEVKMEQAEEFIQGLISGKSGKERKPKERAEYVGPEPVEGQLYTGKITGIHPFGVFVEILPGAEDGSTPGLEGLVHVSELARERVRNCEGFMRSMNVEELTVKYLGKENGKLQLSRKAALEDQYGKITPNGSSNNQRGGGGSRGGRPDDAPNGSKPPEKASMAKEELDVIAKAIEGLKDI